MKKTIDAQFHIVGTRYYDDTFVGRSTSGCGPMQAIMKSEPGNPFDREAVAVYEVRGDGPHKVGYVSRTDLSKIHALFEQTRREEIPVAVMGLEPGRTSTLLAFPAGPRGLVKDISVPEGAVAAFGACGMARQKTVIINNYYVGSVGSVGQLAAGHGTQTNNY